MHVFDVYNLIRLYLTVPMTSAIAKHTFSTLFQLKNLPTKYYDPRMTKPCHAVTYT